MPIITPEFLHEGLDRLPPRTVVDIITAWLKAKPVKERQYALDTIIARMDKTTRDAIGETYFNADA